MQLLHHTQGIAAQLDPYQGQFQGTRPHCAEQALPGMAELLDRQQANRPRGAFEAVHLTEQRLDGLTTGAFLAPVGQAVGKHAEALLRLHAKTGQQLLLQCFAIQTHGVLTAGNDPPGP
ncbi:hypothetical protein D3C86_1806650 [compost metagenome]